MLGRLGNVFYWLGCIIAGVFIAGCVYALFAGANPSDANSVALIFGFLALIAYGIGRALRYILGGDEESAASRRLKEVEKRITKLADPQHDGDTLSIQPSPSKTTAKQAIGWLGALLVGGAAGIVGSIALGGRGGFWLCMLVLLVYSQYSQGGISFRVRNRRDGQAPPPSWKPPDVT
jgi:hypothetical protein